MDNRDNGFHILEENLDEEILKQMPEWFRILCSAYRNKVKCRI